MAKYHISKDGFPAVCNAHHRPCPIGGDHFDSKAEALEAAEALLEEEEELFNSHKKAVYHVDASGAAAPCTDEKKCKVKPFGVFNNVHSSDMNTVFGAAQAFRASVGALQNEGGEVEASPPPRPRPAVDPITQQARQARQQAMTPITQKDPSAPGPGDKRVIDGVVHEWGHIRGDGCRTTMEYGWRKTKVAKADTPDPVEGEERTVNGRRIQWTMSTRTGQLESRDLGPDEKNRSGDVYGIAKAKPSYGNSWAGGVSYSRC